ncbi:Rrf2 family transcriptional regulator [Ameyamaea chiangmaiensis NBRC 103196]|uniref:Rrf2 family transcriptional regulator n=1 Tax=Ameyamaea chiangmaiensis TaxID=442969 RepID=A0A850P9V0_9PROT|nr:Rrf2 family transcriptional regulator [Ameyamaea chiangmaiensis]MBS4076454.1 Rrf2 family transcriptional regulator [Ameyamaea chiangmaiensis]NVN41337.1 Rrf2 family transcriptional regulator [Ameyamaea chiangmaiensis]GBQ61948.1 Rrf2 family transcriptional regulator [Ameyamaea chiangmaiensis NBRC 103196]
MFIRRDRAMISVVIMLDVAFHAGRGGTVSAADIAERAGLARRGIEPLLQALSRSSLLESVRGPRGGYRLGRPRRDITLAEIVDVAVADDSAGDDGPQGALFAKVVEPCWEALDRSLVEQMQTITLDDLVRRAESAGMRRPMAEPISFSI